MSSPSITRARPDLLECSERGFGAATKQPAGQNQTPIYGGANWVAAGFAAIMSLLIFCPKTKPARLRRPVSCFRNLAVISRSAVAQSQG